MKHVQHPSTLGLNNTPTASLHRGITPPQRVSLILHETIWWWGSSNTGFWWMTSTSSVPSLSVPLWHGVVAPNRVLSMGPVELFIFKLSASKWLTLNWIVKNRTILSFNYVHQEMFFFQIIHLIRCAFKNFPDFFVQAFKINIDTWKFSMSLQYILWDNWPIFMISASNEQLQQQLEYTKTSELNKDWNGELM